MIMMIDAETKNIMVFSNSFEIENNNNLSIDEIEILYNKGVYTKNKFRYFMIDYLLKGIKNDNG